MVTTAGRRAWRAIGCSASQSPGRVSERSKSDRAETVLYILGSCQPAAHLTTSRPRRSARAQLSAVRPPLLRPRPPAPNGYLIEAPWLVHGGHGGSIR
jgi:hypothetical protein